MNMSDPSQAVAPPAAATTPVAESLSAPPSEQANEQANELETEATSEAPPPPTLLSLLRQGARMACLRRPLGALPFSLNRLVGLLALGVLLPMLMQLLLLGRSGQFDAMALPTAVFIFPLLLLTATLLA